MRLKNYKAITLIEVTMTAVIFTLVASGIYTTFMIGTRSWVYYNDTVILKQEVRRSIFGITQELREAKNIFINKDPNGVTINFYRPMVGNVSYSWTSQGADANKIIRKLKNEQRVLASHVAELSFNQETTDDVTIEVRATKFLQRTKQEISFQLREKIALRAKTGIMKAEDDDS
jgi:hypothetical protein